MVNLILNSLLNLTVEFFVWVAMWRIGVPINYIVAAMCTVFILKSLHKIQLDVRKATTLIIKEQILQTRVLCKLAQVNEEELLTELKNDFKQTAVKHAAN